MRAQLLAHLLLQGDARVEHHPQQPDELQVGVQVACTCLMVFTRSDRPSEREVFALHRHDHAMGAAQAVEREQAQRGRAVDQHEVVVGGHSGQCTAQAFVAMFQFHQLHFGAGQFAVGAHHVVAARLRTAARFGDAGRLQQHVIHREFEGALVHARAHRGIALRVQVDHQHALPHPRQASGEVDGGGGFCRRRPSGWRCRRS